MAVAGRRESRCTPRGRPASALAPPGRAGRGGAVTVPLSPENPLVKELRQLHRPEGRRAARALLVEGRRAIAGFLAAGWRAEVVLAPPDEAAPADWQARPCSPRAAARLSQSSSPSGWFARFPLPDPGPLRPATGGLVLAEIADPGNAGTLVRSAAAFGIGDVVVVGGADPWSHKVVQASAGALAAVRIHRLDPAAGLGPLTGGAPLAALVVEGGADPATVPPGPRWLVVGSEAHGLRPEWQAVCNERLTLPMPGAVESLNAAVAGSIACYLLGRGSTGDPMRAL